MNTTIKKQARPELLVIANYSGMYGSERMLTFMIAALQKVFALDLVINPSVGLDLTDIHGVPVRKQFFHVISKSDKFSAVLDLPRWIWLLLKIRPKVVVLNISLIPAPLLVGWLLGMQTVVFVRESLSDHPSFFWVYHKYLALFASHVVCNSSYTASMFSLPASRVHILSDCVDHVAALVPTEEFHISLLYVGRLSERKGLAMFLDALCKLDEMMQARIRVTMVGDCMEDQQAFVVRMQTKCKSLKCFEVQWVGYQQEPWGKADWGTVLIAPSLLPETFGLTVAEALTRGIPVIANKVGAYPELVKHGVNGFQSEITSDDLAANIRLALHLDAEHYQQLSSAAVQSSSGYTKEKYEESIRRLFCKLFR